MEDEYNLSNIIGKRLEVALGELGNLLWAYVVLSKKDIACIFGVTNYPSEWVKKYQEQGLQYIDPVVLTARNRLTPSPGTSKSWRTQGCTFLSCSNRPASLA